MKTSTKRHLVSLVVLAALAICPTFSNATGPSYLVIKIRPVAVSRTGEVLFKTYLDRNGEGCHGWCMDHTATYGWLVASSRGVWEEITFFTIVPSVFKDEDAILRKKSELDTEYEGSVDLANPPPAIRDLFSRYGFGQGRVMSPDTGKEEITWTPTRTPQDSNGPVTSQSQMTLGKVISDPDTGTMVKATYYFSGVAVFKNEDSDVTELNHGATFTLRNLPNMKTYGSIAGVEEDIGYDSQTIDGICFLTND